jgi:UDP-GlcNAc:undecaprenyl-phosphate GlcNAc-1-phosphate transferase
MLASIALTFGSALIVAFILTPRIRDYAITNELVDYGSARKVHVKPMPRLGGVALASGFAMAVLVLHLLCPDLLGRPQLVMIAGGILASALGVYDDVLGMSAKRKLLLQVAIAAGAWTFGLRVHDVALPGLTLHLGLFSLPCTILWIVGVMNAVNLIDGLDGLAASLSVVGLLGITLVALLNDRAPTAMLAVALIGAVLGFLVYNKQPASIFMGDGGSLFLGFMLSVLSLRAASSQVTGSLTLMTPILFVAIPIFDTLSAFTRRALRGQSPFKGDKEHVHHRLLRQLGSHRAVGHTLCGFACLFSSAGVIAVVDGSLATGSFVAVFGALGIVLLARTVRRATAAEVAAAPLLPLPEAPVVASTSAVATVMADVIPITTAKPRRRRQSFDSIVAANDNQKPARDIGRG